LKRISNANTDQIIEKYGCYQFWTQFFENEINLDARFIFRWLVTFIT